MAVNPYLEQFRAVALSAARGIEQALQQDPTNAVSIRLGLERLGDLLRSGARALQLGAWASSLTEERISQAVRSAEAEAKTWPLPEHRLFWRESDERNGDGPLEFMLQRRDETESLREAVVQVRLRGGHSPINVDGWRAFSETLRQVDVRLVETVPRQLAEHLLGVRVGLERPRDWVSQLTDTAAVFPRVSTGPGDLKSLSLPSNLGEPSDQIIADYVATGARYRYVEGYARTNPNFAEELANTIDVLEIEGELGTAFLPRRWRKSYSRSGGAGVEYELTPSRLAAADARTVPAAHKLELGMLPGFEAEVDAQLVLSAGFWTLTVEVASGQLKTVHLNDHVQTAPEADGSWRAQAPLHGDELHLRVEDASGGVFDERLHVRVPTP